MKITLVLVLQMIKILLLFEPIIVNMYDVPITAYVESSTHTISGLSVGYYLDCGLAELLTGCSKKKGMGNQYHSLTTLTLFPSSVSHFGIHCYFVCCMVLP